MESSVAMQNLIFKYVFIKDASVPVYILSVDTTSTPACHTSVSGTEFYEASCGTTDLGRGRIK